MKREVAEAWVRDLRANAGAQGSGALKTHDGKYCCLGRLCLVMGFELVLDGGRGWVRRGDFSWEDGGLETSQLPDDLVVEAGLTVAEDRPYGQNPRWMNLADLESRGLPRVEWLDGEFSPRGAGTLAGANDKGCPFSVIADYVERHWESL